MTLNKDGLVPGADVSWNQMRSVQLKKPEPKAAITRADVSKMDRSEVLELLEAHGVEGATGKVGELRATLTEIMFLGE